MRVKIESNGHARDTKITNSETGEVIPNIARVEIVLDAEDGITRATLYTIVPELDIEADAEIEYVPVAEIGEYWVKNIPRKISEHIKKKLVEEKRPGGLLNK